MKKKSIIKAIILGTSVILSSINACAETITLENGQAFESEEALWDYLESTYPIVYYDDILSGNYTDQYVIIDSYAKKATIDESIHYLTCDMYFLQSDEKYKKQDLWACFYDEDDMRKQGIVSSQDCLAQMQSGDTLRGCYKVASDNSIGPYGMLAIKKTNVDTSDISLTETVHLNFASSVPNDVTGNWRLATTRTSCYITEYALNYYKTYFKSDNEIHGVINFSDNTTSSLSIIGGELNVTVYRYVDGEEKDAKLLFGGEYLEQYYINLETGNIEKVS